MTGLVRKGRSDRIPTGETHDLTVVAQRLTEEAKSALAAIPRIFASS